MATRYIVGGVLFLLVISVRGAVSESDPAPRAFLFPVTQPHSQFSFTLKTPDPEFSVRADGSFSIGVEGFETFERRVGAPDIPTRTVLVAIPRDATPKLEVRASRARLQRSLRPAAVPQRYVEVSPEERAELERPGRSEVDRQAILQRSIRERRAPDAAIYGGETPFPERVAWLGRTGVLRDQRYVEVHLAPVQYDPRITGLRIHDSLEIVVRFNGVPTVDLKEEEPVPSSSTDDRFEMVYRNSFLNYDQSRSFRYSSAESVETAEIAPEESSARMEAAVAATPRSRIRLRATALVRLDEATLQATGFLAHDVATWKLTHLGVQVPLQTNDDGDGIIEPGEWVQFYGQALDDEPKTELNTDFPGTNIDLFEARDFTDENTYFLTVAAQAQPTIPELDALPGFSLTPPAHFGATQHLEIDDAFRPLGAADPWYWLPSLSLSSPQAMSRTDQVPLPGLFSGTEAASIRVHLRGLSEDPLVDPDHQTRVTIENGSNQVLAIDDGGFDRRTLFLHQIDWTWTGGAELTDPLDVVLEVMDSGATCFGSPCNSVILDYIEVDYRRAFEAIGDSLVFDWPNENAEFVVTGLQDPNPDIYEITLAAGERVIQPVRLINASVTGTGPYDARFLVGEDTGMASGAPRRFAVVGDAGVVASSEYDLEPDTVSDLRLATNQADLIVIAHSDLLDQGPASPLTLLLDHRATPAGGGLTSKVVLLQDIEDEFNDGLPGPLAIKEFLRWITSDQPGEGWTDPKPSYVILLGDASLDYKGGTAQGNFVSTQMVFMDDPQLGYHASDNVMGAVIGDDQLADLVLGRIPARSVAEANRMLQKILDYEQVSPAGSWRNHALFVSDRGKTGNNPSEALQFEALNADSEAWMAIPPYTSRHLRYWTDYFDTPDPTPWDSVNADLKATVNGFGPIADGAAIVQFIGHGNFVLWSEDFFFDERINPPSDTFQDTMDLINSARLPWLMAHNCLTGGFHVIAHNSVAENWFKLAGGGAVGAFAPTGLSFNFISDDVIDVVWGDMFGPTKQRVVGPMVLDALARLCGQGATEACQYYALQGDPAMRLVLRDVEPATSLQAAGANARVDLSWTASATPLVVYDIYRADNLLWANYTKIADDVAGTNYSDSGVINARTYYYYLVAQDPDGFESRWSNFNSDCAGSGPDCVQVTPLNPDPPLPPAGASVADPGLGHVLELSWAANGETDVASYTVHYGMESATYTTVVEVGPATRLTLLDLVEGQMYYFAVTATNTSNLTSGFSIEVSDYPVFGLGLRNPSYIENLMLGKSGSDLVLEWPEVTTDIYGKPKSVALYEILRGAAPDFDGVGLTKIGECADPCSTFTDTGALLLAGGLEYRVRAVDGESNAGGMGSEPPEAVDLGIKKSTSVPGNLILHWDPVTTTVDGKPVVLQHYAVFIADQPFTRADIRDGLIAPTATVASSSFELTPPLQSRYYSVLAVDTRGNTSPF